MYRPTLRIASDHHRTFYRAPKCISLSSKCPVKVSVVVREMIPTGAITLFLSPPVGFYFPRDKKIGIENYRPHSRYFLIHNLLSLFLFLSWEKEREEIPAGIRMLNHRPDISSPSDRRILLSLEH